MQSGVLTPRGRKVVRIEAVAELEYGEAIQIVAERLSGQPAGAEIPPGFKGDAIRLLLAHGADKMGIADEANRRADEIRESESHE